MAQNYDVSFEILDAIHKEWDAFKKFVDNSPVLLFVGPMAAMPGTEGVVCNICTALGGHPGSVLLRTKDGKLNAKQKELLDNFVSRIKKVSHISVYSI